MQAVRIASHVSVRLDMQPHLWTYVLVYKLIKHTLVHFSYIAYTVIVTLYCI